MMDVLFGPSFIGASAVFGPQVSFTVLVSILGVSASPQVGQVGGTGSVAVIATNITEDMVCKVVRHYIKAIAPADMRVLRTPVNRASRPTDPYVSFTPGLRRPLSTNVDHTDSNSRTIRRPEQMSFQIDCYGMGSSDLAELLNALYRDPFAVESFAESGLEIVPLYAGDIRQAPFENDEGQYEYRYLFEIELQVNSVIVIPQQTSNTLSIDLQSVDANFPPNEG